MQRTRNGRGSPDYSLKVRTGGPSSPQRSGDVAAVDGGDVRGRLERQRVVQKGLGDIVGGHLAAEEVACEVIVLAESASFGAGGDQFRGQQAAAYAVGVDGVGADAVGAVIERVLTDKSQGRGLRQTVRAEIRPGVDRLLRHVEQQA